MVNGDVEKHFLLKKKYFCVDIKKYIINNIAGEQLCQVWQFSAKCAKRHVTTWSAPISGRIRCKTAPYLVE